MIDEGAGDVYGFVGGVVEQLNVESVARIFDPADGLQQAINHELLVENRELDGDVRQVGKFLRRRGGPVVLLLVVQINERVAVKSVRSEQNKDDEIGYKERHVKGVGGVKAFERGIEKMLAEVLREPALGDEGGESCCQQRHLTGGWSD